MIGVVEELVAYHAAIIHCAEAWLKPSIDMGVRAIAGMVDAVTGIPWSFADGDIPVSVCAKLREPRHVTASRFEAAVEGDIFGAHGGRPCVGDHHALFVGNKRHVVGVVTVEGDCRRPRHTGDGQPLLIERNPFEKHIAGGALHPYIGFKGVCAVPKAGEDAANAGSRAGFALFVGDGSGIGEREGALRALQGQLEISAGIPFGTVARKSELHCSFIESHGSAGYGEFHS